MNRSKTTPCAGDCGRLGYGLGGVYMCEECYPVDEDALEDYEERRRQRIARENEY